MGIIRPKTLLRRAANRLSVTRSRLGNSGCVDGTEVLEVLVDSPCTIILVVIFIPWWGVDIWCSICDAGSEGLRGGWENTSFSVEVYKLG